MSHYLANSIAAFLLLLSTPVLANPNPNISIGSTPTPYGVAGCMQRGENILYRIGATSITPGTGGQALFAAHGANTVGIWCRGSEAVVVVAGDQNPQALRQDVSRGL